MFAKIWRWLKNLWQQLLGKPPQPSPPGAGTPGGKATDEQMRVENQPLSDADYEFLFIQLLEGVEHGWQKGRVSKFLSDLNNRTSETEFAAWLRRFGSKLLESPETHRELGRRMVQLGKVAGGELGDVAGEIGRELLGNSETQTSIVATSFIPTVDKKTANTTISVYADVPVDVDGEAVEWYSRGVDEYNTGNIQSAVGCFQRAIDISPNFHHAWNGLGNMLKDLGQYQEAIEAFQRAIAIYPNFHSAWNGLGNVLYSLGQYQEAIEAFQKAIAIYPNYHHAWNGLGNMLSDLGQYQQALEAYQKAIEISPNFHIAWNGLGATLSDLGQYQEAIEAFQRAIDISPNYHDAWNGLGNALYDLGQYQEAIKAFQKAIEISPNYHEAWNGLGNALYGLGQYQQAREAFQKAIDISPNFHIAWNGLGNALRDLGQYQKAIEAFNRALEITHNQFWQAWANRGWAIYNLQGYQAALQNWDEGLQSLQPETPDYQEGCTVLHQFKGFAHYDYGKQQPNPHPYWRESRNSYITALKTLSGSETSILGEVLVVQVSARFQLKYLEILQNLAQVCNALNYQDDFQLCLDIGDTMLENLLLETDSQERKIQLANKFATFSQLRVVLLAQSSQPKEALLLAEKRKNLCLRWLRESCYVGMKDETPLQYPEIEQFLDPGMAAIYWHYSPAAITTFIIKDDGIQIHSPENTPVKQLEKFEDWLKAWKKDYQNNRKDAKNAKEEKETWREKMADRLDELGKILDVEGILNKIGNDITHLILIPHRDLHLLPLHYLLREKDFTITYLPSLKVGIDLQTDTPSTPQKLLSIESPSRLEYAETESQIIAQIYDNPTWIKSSKATKNTVIAAFSNSADIFHFTGHGEHNIDQPLDSALELANQEKLTLQDIFQLNLKGYQLACLSACETGITSKQGIIDEYVGLVSGFLAKGVTHVVSTLWQVGETETALMMIKFHQLYKDNIPPALALQQTKTWLSTLTFADLIQWYRQESAKLEEGSGCWESLQGAIIKAQQEAEIKGMSYRPYAHPYHWAGFIVSGNHKNPIVSCPLDYP